jgi:hypothetical protein
VFGAEGPPSTRSLGRAFLRAIPVASQQDPVWAAAPVGDTGKLEAVIRVDETGHIASAEPRAPGASKALVSLLRRTIPLLEAGTFALRDGAVTAGTEVLEVRATVTDLPPGADEPGGAITLSHDYERGRAAFTQANGRHVEVTLKALRVESR